MKEIKVKPRFWPRDIIDVLFVIIWVILFLLILNIFVFFIIIVTRNVKVGLFIYYVVLFIPLIFVVWSITLSDKGIKFNRLIGKPRFLKWNEIKEIKVTNRREVLLKGWFSPLFLKREITPSMSLLKHYKIVWNSDYCFYPPSNTEQFDKLIKQFKVKSK